MRWLRLVVGGTHFLTMLIALWLLGACAGRGLSPSPQSDTPVSTPAPVSPTPDPSVVPEEPSPTPETGVSQGPVTLRVWLPPQFDPNAGTPAGELLAAQLHTFNTLYPGVRVVTRIKATTGSGGVLESLSATESISQQALPDLVAVSRTNLEAAAIKGLLFPYDEILDLENDSEWYEYALQLGRLEDKTFGLPFAGNSLLLVYRPEFVENPPRDWDATLELEEPLLIPAGSRQALFTLALYQASGGHIQDEEGRPSVDVGTLADVFGFYRDAQSAGVMSDGTTRYLTLGDTWSAFQGGEAHLAISWMSDFLQTPVTDTVATLLPTPGSVPFTLADGWLWAITTPDSDRQVLSAALAQSLTSTDFLAQWTHAAGYLPTRPGALADWPRGPERTLASRVILAAEIIPPLNVLNTLGPALQQATTGVLTNQMDPATAAEEVAARLEGQ